jgi:hypothetical protein
MDWSTHYPAFLAEGEEPNPPDAEELIPATLPELEERLDVFERNEMWEAELTRMATEPESGNVKPPGWVDGHVVTEEEVEGEMGGEAMDMDVGRVSDPEPEVRVEEPEAKVARPKKMRKMVEVADIGCGFGGLLFSLSPVLPDTLLLGKTSPSPGYGASTDISQAWRSASR